MMSTKEKPGSVATAGQCNGNLADVISTPNIITSDPPPSTLSEKKARATAYETLADFCAGRALAHLDDQKMFGCWFLRSVLYWMKFQQVAG